jgi:hypothetical protein
LQCRRRATFGQKQPLAAGSGNVRLRIRKATFEPIAAAQNDLFGGYVGIEIEKRKSLSGDDFVAF